MATGTYQTMTTTVIIVNMTRTIRSTKRRTSFSSVVNPVLGSLDNFAILPKTVESPVDTTMPVAFPDTQCVP